MAVRNLAYELSVGGAGIAPHIVKGLQGTSLAIEKLDTQAAGLRETLKGQNAELKRMRGAGEQGSQAYIDLQAAAGETKMELGLVGQSLRKAQHEQRLAAQTAANYRTILLRTGAVVGGLSAAYVGVSAAIIGVGREQRELAHQARTSGVSFYDYTSQLNANTLALDGNAAAGRAASAGLIDASRQTRLFSVGLADIDTTNLAVAGVNLERFMAAARDPSGRDLGGFLRNQYREIDRIADATERQRRLDALRTAIGGELFGLAEKTAALTDAEYARQNELAAAAAANAEARRAEFEDLNKTLSETDLAFDNIKTTLAGIAAPELEKTFSEWNRILEGANQLANRNEGNLRQAIGTARELTLRHFGFGQLPGTTPVPDVPAGAAAAGGQGGNQTTSYGGNTFYVTIDSVAGANQSPEEAGMATVEAIDYWLARSTASR